MQAYSNQRIYFITTPIGGLNINAQTDLNTCFAQQEIFTTLSWLAPSTNPLLYEIYRDGELIGIIIAGSSNSFTDHNRKKGVTHTYRVVGRDGSALTAEGETTITIQ